MILTILTGLYMLLSRTVDGCPAGCNDHGHSFYVFGAGHLCTCDHGYGGICCDSNMNDCLRNSCNHGTCHDGIASYSCSCYGGYTGRYCEKEINECASSPCQHSAVCHDYVNRYSCTCQTGYTGTNCEIDINECASNPCQHQASCIDHISSYTCSCTVGYTGKHCEMEINECASSPCQHSAVCHDFVNRYACTCKSGYTGTNCEIDINDCASNPCQHQASCIDHISSYTCSCTVGYTGKHCEMEINECTSSPCQHSAVCHDYVNRYSCTCKSGYTGTNCEIDIDDCASNPCQHQGSCIDHISSYTCSCTVGYTGKHCEMNIECHSNPCLNGGICTDDQTTGHTCHCPPGFTGYNCETAPSIMIKPSVSLANIKTVVEGSSVLTILCNAEGIPMPSVTWESLEKSSLPHNAKQVAHYLIFENVSTIDGGHYVCTAKNRVGIDIKVVQVIVNARNDKNHVAPVIHAPSTIQVKYYTEAIITCNVTGFPTPTVAWIHNDNPVQFSGNTLVIHRVTNATTGTYTCIATNDAGSSQANILLKVSYDVPKIVSPPVTAVIIAGHAHNFTCIATGHPQPTIIWTYNMFTKHTTDMPSHKFHKHDSVLTLNSMSTQESGLLTCSAQNEFGEDHVSVSVIVRSRIVIQSFLMVVTNGECLIYLRCGHGYRTNCVSPHCTCVCDSGWEGGCCSHRITACASSPCQNQGSCIDHELEYTCVCPERYTGKNCDINFECHSSPCLNGGICTDEQASGHTCHCPLGFTGHNCATEPFILVKPKINLAENKTVPEGHKTLIIPCYAEGIPEPVITWGSLDRVSIPSNGRQLAHFLVFQNVSTIDGGLYMCTAKNKVGTDIKVIEVIVTATDEKRIAPVIYATSSVEVKYYLERRLTCNVTGVPTPTVIWKHNNNIVQSSGNTLVINRVTNATSGTYTCIATNVAGTSQANIQLKVTYDVPKIINPPVTSVIMAGQTHNFTCIATGHPKPSIKWTYKMYSKHTTEMPSHQLHNRGTVLTLYYKTTHESGLLTCTAQNEFGEDHVSVSVILRSPNPVG